MRATRPAPFRFSLGKGADPSRERRTLLPQTLPPSCALSRLNLRPATVAFGKGAPRPGMKGYACLTTTNHQSGAHSGDESGDDEEAAVLPQRHCYRCCLFLCVLALMAGSTGFVLRFLLARDAHPSSPAAKLVGLSPRRAPLSKPKASRTAVALVGSTRQTSPPPLFKNPGPPLPPPPPKRYSPPWPPWPLAPNPPPEPSPPPMPHPPPTPPCAPWPPLIQSPPPPSPPLPLREPGLLTIPAVAARVAARNNKHHAKNQTR